MEKRDFRSLDRETQEALRVRAMFLVLQLHKTQAEAAEAVGVKPSDRQPVETEAAITEQVLEVVHAAHQQRESLTAFLETAMWALDRAS